MLVDGPSAEHDLVLRGRLEGQAPDIDPLVYLTDCDPSDADAGTVRSGRSRRQPGYDLVARPFVAVAARPLGVAEAEQDSRWARDKLEGHLGGGRLQVGSCPLFLFRRTMQPLEQIRAIAERVAAVTRAGRSGTSRAVAKRAGHVVRVFIDRPGPSATPEDSVSIEDCEQVNREIGTILDVEDPLPVRVHA